MKICISLIALVLSIEFAYSQVADVNLSTGQLEFTKTLMTVKGKKLSFPINLTYNSRVTAHQPASWVGLGFDLDMPYIEREVNGYPDDQGGGQSKYNWTSINSGWPPVTSDWPFSKDSSLMDLERQFNPRLSGESQGDGSFLFFDYYYYQQNGHQMSEATPPEVYFGPVDPDRPCINWEVIPLITENGTYYDNGSQQDIYRLKNFSVANGQIFFPKGTVNKGAPVLTPYNPAIKVACDYSSGGWGFKIIDENGTQYFFNACVLASPSAFPYQTATITYDDFIHTGTIFNKINYTYVKRWYLSKIQSYDGDVITISYNQNEDVDVNTGEYISSVKYSTWANRQIVVSNTSERIFGLSPAKIVSSLQTVNFVSTAINAQDRDLVDIGRGKLDYITLIDSINNTVLETDIFNYSPDGFYNNLIKRSNFIKLTGITQRKAPGIGGLKKMYCFEYVESAPPSDDGLDIVSDIMLNKITDLQGNSSEYVYEPGTFNWLSNNQQIRLYGCGVRVANIVENGSYGTTPITTTIQYEGGEIGYNSAFNSDGDGEPYYIEDRWRELFPVLLEDISIHYRKVKTFTTGRGSVEYDYYSSSDSCSRTAPIVGTVVYPLKDDLNEYHANESCRYFLKNVRTPVKTLHYEYDIIFLDTLGKYTYSYRKPRTHGVRFWIINNDTNFSTWPNYYASQYCVAVPEGDFFNKYLVYGIEEAVTASAVMIQLKSVTQIVDGVQTQTSNKYNTFGLLKTQEETSGSTSFARKTSYQYGYEGSSERDICLTSNILSPVYQTEFGYKKQQVDWASFGNYVYPKKSYVWNGTKWTLQEEYTRRGELGYEIEKMVSGGTLPVTTIRRNDNLNVIAQISNARFLESAVLTDFFDNGWVNVGGTSCTTQTHFSTKSILVTNNFGPTRNFKIYPNKDYIVSAWVKPVSGTVQIWGDYRHLGSGADGNNIPLELGEGVKSFGGQPVTVSGAGDWQRIEIKIRAKSDLTSIDWAQNPDNWYARVYVGTPAGGQVYIDDIRIYPVGAQVSTMYYDNRNRVICAVDANNSAKYTEYDNWDRIIRVRNNKKQVMLEKTYKLFGDL